MIYSNHKGSDFLQNSNVTLVPFVEEDREQFIKENQWAFKYGALQEFGERDNHIDDDGEIISKKTIEACIDDPQNHTYRIMLDGKKVGGAIVKIDEKTLKIKMKLYKKILKKGTS